MKNSVKNNKKDTNRDNIGGVSSSKGKGAYFSRIFGYLSAVAAAVVFALYLNAGVGWTFVYVLITAAVLSITVTVIIKNLNCITVSFETNGDIVYKNEPLVLKVKVKNKSIFSMPLLIINLFTPDTMTNIDGTAGGQYVLGVSPRSETQFEVRYKVNVWGCSNVGIKSVKLMDFMRFISFSLYTEKGFYEYGSKIRVIPDIPELAAESLLLREVSENAIMYDDNEDTKEAEIKAMFSGLPGYSHREYTQGDPLKRINWKLSMKRDNYMVRLDDEVQSVQQNIILDTLSGVSIYDNERAVEGVLALCSSIVKSGFEPKLYYKQGNDFTVVKMNSVSDVASLQTAFADYSFINPSEKDGYVRIPEGIIPEGGYILIYTPRLDKELIGIVYSLRENGSHVTVVSSDSLSEIKNDGIWHIKEDYSAVK